MYEDERKKKKKFAFRYKPVEKHRQDTQKKESRCARRLNEHQPASKKNKNKK